MAVPKIPGAQQKYADLTEQKPKARLRGLTGT